VGVVQVLEERQGEKGLAGVKVIAGEIPGVALAGLRGGLGLVVIERIDVAEIDKLLDELGGVGGIELGAGRMLAGVAGDFFP